MIRCRGEKKLGRRRQGRDTNNDCVAERALGLGHQAKEVRQQQQHAREKHMLERQVEDLAHKLEHKQQVLPPSLPPPSLSFSLFLSLSLSFSLSLMSGLPEILCTVRTLSTRNQTCCLRPMS